MSKIMNKQEVFDVDRKKIAVNVVGKIRLDESGNPIAEQSVPAEMPSREEVRKQLDAWQPKKWKDMVDISCAQRYADGDILDVKIKGGGKCIAIGCIDPINRKAGYYIAVGLYGDGVVTKMSDKQMEDGCMAGEWPDTVKHIGIGDGTTQMMARTFLEPQIAKERELFRELLVDEYLELLQEQRRLAEEERRKREEDEERHEREKQEAIQRLEEEKARLEEEERAANDVIPEDLDFEHLPLSRGQKTLRNSNWPRVDGEIDSASYFGSMATLASLFTAPMPTYVMSRTYTGFLYHEMKEQLKDFSTVRNLLGESNSRAGVLCYQKTIGKEIRDFTVPYYVGSHAKSGTEFIRFAIIVDGQMFGTYIHSRKNAVVQPYVTHTLLLSRNDPDYTLFNMKESCVHIINMILCHIMMEQQLDALTNDNADDNDNRSLATVTAGSPIGDDVLIRTKAWYNSIAIPSTVVASYESHRWKGSGENKTLEPVTVSGYTKGAYTRQAQCINQ